jgi:hypothetical protein
MDFNAYYKVTDTRPDPTPSQGAITRVNPVPGGIMFWDSLDKDHKLEWDDDREDTFIDDEKSGTLIVVTATGSVMFQKVPMA